jgi:ABC-type amino acid transport substrate-binding protein
MSSESSDHVSPFTPRSARASRRELAGRSFSKLVLSIGLLAVLGASGCAAIARKTPVVVASDLDNPPFAWVDAEGQPAGRDVEMMRALARAAGLELEWRRMPFEELCDAAAAGSVDVVCATLGITPERAERVLFTAPYFTTVIAVVVRAGAGEPGSLAELSGRRVAAGAGTTSERAVRAHLSGAVGVYENKEGLDSGARLATRTVDAVVLDGPAAEALVAASAGKLRRLPEDLAAERYALALPHDRAALRAALDRALGELTRAWADLDARHGLDGR